jgi:hypothetical protein
VFTLWVTLFALYIVNVIADYAAASTMAARHIGELRWGSGRRAAGAF